MRARPFVVVAVVLGAVAQAAVAQQTGGGIDAGSATAPPPSAPLAAIASLEGAPSSVAPSSVAPPSALTSRVARRDPCAEVLRAVQFEDESGAVAAFARCRALMAPEGHVPTPEAIRALEDATEALHGLRRDDGAFCVEPSAPFDFRALLAGAADTRACLLALDLLLSSDNAIWRFVLADEYASGRLAARGGYDADAARRARIRPPLPGPDTPAERELVAIARLAGRHFMRTCRCLPGPAPDSVTSVRAMALPSTVEGVILRALGDREGTHAEP
jgi:hypothetical protein